MAVLASSFRRRYTPHSVRFALDNSRDQTQTKTQEQSPLSWPDKLKDSPVENGDSFVRIFDVEMDTDVEDEDDHVRVITVKSVDSPDLGSASSELDLDPNSLSHCQAAEHIHSANIHTKTAGPSVANHSYTGSPIRLLIHDLAHVVRLAWAVPYFVWPLRPTGLLSELALTLANVWCIAVHVILSLLQVSFLFGIFPAACMLLPAWTCALLAATFIGMNQLACRLFLNGWRGEAIIHSSPECATSKQEHAGEQWIFLNGVGTGTHWLQSSIDRLAYTFQRPVMGIHNKTCGLVFDIIECLVQRNLNYATRDVRVTYSVLKETLYRTDINKVVLVLHSQGGIVGSMAIDWLMQELPQELMDKLEVFTFGNAANHFNFHTKEDSRLSVEHYAHTTDFVALWGVLHYTSSPSSERSQATPFAGRVFTRTSHSGGHQLCQHYLDGMFPLTKDERTGSLACSETSEFMNSTVSQGNEGVTKVKEASRLWQYRNGRVPM